MNKLVIMLGCVFLHGVIFASDFSVVTNATPSVAVPAGWIYESAPGTYFWNGFAFSLFAGLLSLAPVLVRRIIGNVPEGGE